MGLSPTHPAGQGRALSHRLRPSGFSTKLTLKPESVRAKLGARCLGWAGLAPHQL